VIPAAKNGLPANVGQVVASATTLLKAIPAGKLNALLADLATALNGRAADLRTIVSASTTFSQEFLAYQTQFRELLANAPPVLNAVTAVSPQLQQALLNTETIVQVLATQRTNIDTLLKQGSSATDLLGGLVNSQASNLGCLLHDTSQIVANLSQSTDLGNLSTSLADNNFFFGAVENLIQPGEAKALTSGQTNNPDAFFLRTRLLLPPTSPAADAYPSAQGLSPIEPGAACDTEFGSGAPAATQAGFQPAAGGTVAAPTPSEADVRGGG
jgi:phospholipid/cholesterol/gamma-HCH transport system substrate-binding protein